MQTSDHPIQLLAKTPSGLEAVLAEELRKLGASEVSPGNRLVAFRGDRKLLYRANLCCRTAIRILIPVARFRARNRRELYNAVREVNFRSYLRLNRTLAVDAISSGRYFPNSLFVAQCTKDAIADQFRDRTGRRPDIDLKRPDCRVNIHIRGDEATLGIDASGESLSHRGYRTEGGGAAPLSEVLAAGMVLLSGWDGSVPLVDPMCGSGTIAIEAALIARNTPPGLIRHGYAFEHFAEFDRQLFERIRNELKSAVAKPSSPQIHASDISRQQIELAQANADRAGVAQDIVFTVQSVEASCGPTGAGTVIMNPPYGERIKPHDIEQLYARIGDTLKQKYQGYTAWILTGNVQAAKRVGLRTSRKIRLYNGPTECRLLKYELYEGTRKP